MTENLEYIIKIQDLASRALNAAGGSAARLGEKMAGVHKKMNDMPISGFRSRLSRLGSDMLSIAGIAGRIGILIAAWSGLKGSVALGAEMEQNRIRFQTYLQSVEKGNQMIKDIAAFSNATPFKNQDIQKAAATLLNFGLSGNKVLPTLQKLGDVSGGNRERFHMLALAYGQMQSAGKLMGQDLLQMINAGFNPLQEISRTTGVSMGVLRDQMSKGAISADMVEKAFASATTKGAAFHQMLLKQSKTLSGKWSTLVGKLQDKVGLFMEKLNPFFSKIVDLGIAIVDGFSKVPKIIEDNAFWFGALGVALSAAAAGYLAVKAPMIALGIATKLQAAWTGLATSAQWAWNAAMTANPVGLIVAGVVALAGAIAYVVYKTEGWGKQWQSLVQFMKLSFKAYVEEVKLYFNMMINGLMIRIDKLIKKWYMFKNALGIGDASKNNTAIENLNNQIQLRQKALITGVKKVIELSKKAKDSLKWELSWNSQKSLKDVSQKIKTEMGLAGNSSQGSSSKGLEHLSTQSADNIITGGKQQRILTINIDKVVENITNQISDGTSNTNDIVDELIEGLTRRMHGATRGLI